MRKGFSLKNFVSPQLLLDSLKTDSSGSVVMHLGSCASRFERQKSGFNRI